MRSLALLVVILLTPSMTQAASGPRWTHHQLADFADVVVTGKVTALSSGWDREINAIYTYVTLDVGEILKGDVVADRITVKQLGGTVDGVVLSVTDQPSFGIGESVLLYLEARPRDGTLYTSGLWQGKWAVQAGARGQKIAVRHAPGAHGGNAERHFLSDALASVAAARRSSAARVTTVVADAELPSASSGFTLLGPFRYLYSPAVDVQAGGQPGLAGGGFVQVQSAIQRWNAAGSPFRYVSGTTDRSPRCSAQMLGNGRVTITFMDPCGEMSDSGGTLALGGSYFVPGEGGSSNGQTFDRAIEGFIVNNDSPTALTYLTNPGCFEDIQTHELGHVLGLNHSADPTALMYATIDSNTCWNGARGLRSDDVQGLMFIYGRTTASGATPPSSAPIDLRVATQGSQLTVSWRDPSQGMAPGATGYRVDFRQGHFDGGPVVASVAEASTTLTLTVPPGVAGPFNVVVTAFNAAGAGPPSERRDFTIGATGGGCLAPPAPIANLTGSVIAGFARVEWSAVAGATRYLVQAGSSPGAGDLFALTDVGASTSVGAAVPGGFSGWVRVFAANACGVSPPADVFVR
jgi:hypothetical protein